MLAGILAILAVSAILVSLVRGGVSVDEYLYDSLLVGSVSPARAATATRTTVPESSSRVHQTSSYDGRVTGKDTTRTSVVEKYAHASVQNALKRTSGEGWEMWNRQAVSTFGNYTCGWATFNATNGETAQMCVHPGRDVVSRYIKSKGRFPDCDKLTQLWQKGDANENAVSVSDQSVYLEIGGNIGSCVMQMLLTTSDVPIIVFEPDPRNRFCMTSTLMTLSQDQRDRVSLFPIALGAETASSTINAAKGNFGNSVVGMAVADHGVDDQQFFAPIPIRVERIDSILDIDNPSWNVPLTKMDVQGFECFVVDGMNLVLQRIGTIATEMADKWLTAQGCSGAALAYRMRAADFDVIFRGKLLKGDPPPKQGLFDILAVKRKGIK
jgi:FkbM family methyltransferase